MPIHSPFLCGALLSLALFCQDSKPTRPASSPSAESRDVASKTVDAKTIDAWITTGIARLVECQENGAWPYEGVYRVNREIPLGYRVGGTAIVGTALLYAAPATNKAAADAVDKGTAYILKHLDDPLLAPSTEDVYDVRVWGHACVLEYFCHLKRAKRMGPHAGAIEGWIGKLVKILTTEELTGGGWNYAGRKAPASFVTAPVAQSLLYARGAGAAVPREIFDRAAESLRRSLLDSGSFAYSGTADPKNAKAIDQLDRRNPLQGSIARSAGCQATLYFLGLGDPARIQKALDAFSLYWDELEKRRKKSGTHLPPFMIAPYYFYYGHRYAAQAIECLPDSERAARRATLVELLHRTRDEDGTWNDREFPRSRAFGTAMAILALMGPRAPQPPMLEISTKGGTK